ncbi:MAG: hypothetical protein LBI17_00260 [Rickettsiales bacterium]|jgi:peptidoglycan hydrolase CwlO-like protein|nr:hypothetical protein [Rickettsiales bacterium]
MKNLFFALAALMFATSASAEDIDSAIARKKLEIERSAAITKKKKELAGIEADIDELKASIKEYDRKMGAL